MDAILAERIFQVGIIYDNLCNGATNQRVIFDKSANDINVSKCVCDK